MEFEPTQTGRHRYTQCGDRLQNVEFATGPKIPTVLWSTSGMWSLMPEGTACPGRAAIQVHGWGQNPL